MTPNATKFMIAREAFHAGRSIESATAYADAALVEKDFGGGSPAELAADPAFAATMRKSVLAAVADELKAAGFDDEAARVK